MPSPVSDAAAPDAFKGKLKLNCHFVSTPEGENPDFEFTINALPKSLTIRAESQTEMDMWIDKLNNHGRVN